VRLARFAFPLTEELWIEMSKSPDYIGISDVSQALQNRWLAGVARANRGMFVYAH